MYSQARQAKRNKSTKFVRNTICILISTVVITYGYFSFHVLSGIRNNDAIDDVKGVSSTRDRVRFPELDQQLETTMSHSQRMLQESSLSDGDAISGDGKEITSSKSSQILISKQIPTDPTLFLTEEGVEKYYSEHLLPLNTVVTNWPPESPDARPADWVDVVPTFDWNDPLGRQAAEVVREAEKPFKVMNVPELAKAKKKWSYDYLAKRFGKKSGNVEVSSSKSFMFWRKKGSAPGPTSYQRMSWKSFLEKAKELDEHNSPDIPHYYWHASASNSDGWIAEDLEHFKKQDNNFFIVDPSEYTVPIACRVGTKGLCNENHYDTHRTFASQVFGSKRWIFQPPSDCSKMYLYPDKHISARHSAVDINSGNINFTKWPLAREAVGIETVVQPGEIAYLPSNWFHHIVSLEFNMQCIARSGHSLQGDDYIEECGFAGGVRSMGGKRPKKRRRSRTLE